MSSRMPSKGHWRPLPTFKCVNSILENTGCLIQCTEAPLESGKLQVESAQCSSVKKKCISERRQQAPFKPEYLTQNVVPLLLL